MPEKLKPCPFCGSKASLIHQKETMLYKDGYVVRCEDELCLVRPETDFFREMESAITVWNRRAEVNNAGK